MLTILKLAAYAFFGYALYEFFRGLTSGGSSAHRPTRQPLTEGVRESIEHEIEGRHGGSPPQPPKGQRVTTAEPDGASASHVVGFGVVTH